MKIIFNQEKPIEFQCVVEPDSAPHKAALDVIRHMPDLNRLVDFARARHAYSTDDK